MPKLENSSIDLCKVKLHLLSEHISGTKCLAKSKHQQKKTKIHNRQEKYAKQPFWVYVVL